MFGATIEHNPNDLPSTEKNRWTPVRKGDIYCSPGCGSKCTFAAYKHAVYAAQAIINMLGEGWESEIWENSGWHYCVHKGDAEVSFSELSGFTASIRADYIFDAYSGTIEASANDPRKAVELVTQQLEEIIARLSRARASATLEPLALQTASVGASDDGGIQSGRSRTTGGWIGQP